MIHVLHQPPAWDEFLDENPRATVFHDPRWGRIMKRAYGNQPFYLTARRGDRVVGTLQLVRQKSLLFGNRLCSLPYFDTAGILAGDPPAAEELLDAAQRLVTAERVKWVELRQPASLREDLPARMDKVDLRRDLPADRETLWRGLEAKVRNQVRKAQATGTVVEIGGKDLLDGFYTVYVRNMRDLGSPPHARRFFELICDTFTTRVRLFLVRGGAVPLAGAFTIMDRRTRYVPWAASDWRFKRQCPNMLLYWSILADSCEGGIGIMDFGRSARDSGTYHFKKQWGACEHPLIWHYVLAENERLPAPEPMSAKYSIAMRCWRRLPVPVAQALGPFLIAKLS